MTDTEIQAAFARHGARFRWIAAALLAGGVALAWSAQFALTAPSFVAFALVGAGAHLLGAPQRQRRRARPVIAALCDRPGDVARIGYGSATIEVELADARHATMRIAAGQLDGALAELRRRCTAARFARIGPGDVPVARIVDRK